MSELPLSGKEFTQEVDRLFSKKFSFQKTYEWHLPPTDLLYVENLWFNDLLMQIKCQLNEVKSRLNDKGDEWHCHTKNVDKSKKILRAIKDDIKPVFLSNAWCKFFEILCSFPLVDVEKIKFNTLHLCEAPGGFISALNYYLCLNCKPNFKWNWHANTLNPYYEGHSLKKVVVDDRLLFPTIHRWHFGSDNTGDITCSTYHSDIANYVCNSDINMVTSDGGVDCSENPAEQESLVSALKLSEIIISLENLGIGGCCILKRFTLFECASICAMYVLNCIFKEVHVFKPATSKSGNSEVYVICLGYVGKDEINSYILHMKNSYSTQDRAMFPEYCVPLSFMQQLQDCCKMFAGLQMEAVLENIDLFANKSSEKENRLNEIQNACVKAYFQKFALKPLLIDEHKFLLRNRKMRTTRSSYENNIYDLKTFYYKITFSKKQMVWKEYLTDIGNRLNECFPESKKRKYDVNTWHPIWRIIKSRKHAYDQNWVTLGKTFSSVMNSKFCNPMILFLWNEISNKEEIQLSTYSTEASYSWEWDSSQCLIKESDALMKTNSIILMGHSEKNSILAGLKCMLGKDVKVLSGVSINETFPCHMDHPRTVVLDTSTWLENNLNPELSIQKRFLREIYTLIQVLETNDCLIINLQSQLTRFTIGVLFLVLSFFNVVSMLSPLSNSSPTAGVVWILCDFQNPTWSDKILEHMRDVLQFKSKDLTVVELVPISLLCGSQFFDVLIDLNNHFLLQKIRSLINIENLKMKKKNVDRK